MKSQPPSVSTPITPQDVQPQRPQLKSKIVLLVMAGAVLAIIAGMLGKSPSGNSTIQQSSALSSTPQSQINRPSIPPPKFRIYKFKNDGISPTSVVVPVNTTDEQLKSLIWFLREKVRSHEFKKLGVKEQSDGIFAVYRGEKCANEQFIDTNGPCGYGEHDDALYQWGIEGDYNKDSGSIREKGDNTVVLFDYKDGWQADGIS